MNHMMLMSSVGLCHFSLYWDCLNIGVCQNAVAIPFFQTKPYVQPSKSRVMSGVYLCNSLALKLAKGVWWKGGHGHATTISTSTKHMQLNIITWIFIGCMVTYNSILFSIAVQTDQTLWLPATKAPFQKWKRPWQIWTMIRWFTPPSQHGAAGSSVGNSRPVTKWTSFCKGNYINCTKVTTPFGNWLCPSNFHEICPKGKKHWERERHVSSNIQVYCLLQKLV